MRDFFAANGRGYEQWQIAGAFNFSTVTKLHAGAKLPKCTSAAIAHS